MANDSVQHPYSTDEIVRLGKERYEKDIRPLVEEEHNGKLLVLDVETGDYEIDREAIGAFDRLKARRPNCVPFIVRVGHRAAYRLGGRFKVTPR